ncbi:MAG: hypothetical protein E7409_06700 [Ruminococcaceae bacterium]|nr:hypothetical protein [Oscillospiraceae bacterium]
MNTKEAPPEEIEKSLSYRIMMEVEEIVVYTMQDAAFPVCPRCGCSFEREYQAYCDRCGQALGWENFFRAKVRYL